MFVRIILFLLIIIKSNLFIDVNIDVVHSAHLNKLVLVLVLWIIMDMVLILNKLTCYFPGLEKVGGSGDLQGSFEAFKFSETSLVRFQVDIY